MKSRIAIAVSGGIDSLTAAYLLKEQGHDVFGIHFLTGHNGPPVKKGDPPPQNSNLSDAISRQLDIPVEIIDCTAPFKKHVVDYFTRTYLQGLTPNPCLVCNPLIKFGTVLDHALKSGATRLATGHYARLRSDARGRSRLLRADDPDKDQSYFLGFLSPPQIARACFPLGRLKKEQVIRLAGEKGLQAVVSKESQDICFIDRQTSYGDFIKNRPEFKSKPGPIETVNGEEIGEHQGLHLFTVGQRRGINCPAAEPYYVLRLDVQRNRLIVGFKKDRFATECTVSHVNWLCPKQTSPFNAHTQLRYRHTAVSSKLIPLNNEAVLVKFQRAQTSVTPGQGAVFFRDQEVLGAGFIDPEI